MSGAAMMQASHIAAYTAVVMAVAAGASLALLSLSSGTAEEPLRNFLVGIVYIMVTGAASYVIYRGLIVSGRFLVEEGVFAPKPRAFPLNDLEYALNALAAMVALVLAAMGAMLLTVLLYYVGAKIRSRWGGRQ